MPFSVTVLPDSKRVVGHFLVHIGNETAHSPIESFLCEAQMNLGSGSKPSEDFAKGAL